MGVGLLLILLFPFRLLAQKEDKRLFIVEIVPASTDAYITTKALEETKIASEMAIDEFKKTNPECRFALEYDLATGTEDQLYDKVSKISHSKGQKVIVGFSRSAFARLVALAAADSDLIGISSGAATTELKKYNSRFVSVAAPLSMQWEVMNLDMEQQGCMEANTAAVFNPSDYFSNQFKNYFEKEKKGKVFIMSSPIPEKIVVDTLLKSKCVFLATNIATSEHLLSNLLTHASQQRIYGTGDWRYHASEFDQMVKIYKRRSSTIIIPTSWDSDGTEPAKAFTHRLKKEYGRDSDASNAGTYDAVLMALGHLCHHYNPLLLSSNNKKNSTKPMNDSRQADAILIDDNAGIRTAWKMVAKMNKKVLLTFASPDEFLENQLATGHSPKEYQNMPWLLGVVGKNAPFGDD